MRELQYHPDREYAQFIVEGIQGGFRIGFDYGTNLCADNPQNMVSAKQHPQPIQEYLAYLAAGRIIGPLALGINVQISRLGVIPKPHQLGKWQLITDLSSPEGSSVNDGIASHLCSVSYASVDDAVSTIVQLEKGTVLAKFDLQSAYRMVSVYPVDQLLQGISWEGVKYVDGALPFGLRSAPKVFIAVADALIWIMGNHGVQEAIHHLDDFLVLGYAGSDVCCRAWQMCTQPCQRLGVAVAPHRMEGPSSKITFLGILIDSDSSAPLRQA